MRCLNTLSYITNGSTKNATRLSLKTRAFLSWCLAGMQVKKKLVVLSRILIECHRGLTYGVCGGGFETWGFVRSCIVQE